MLAVEEPLEIRLLYGPEGQRQERAISITMRTPGADEDLALGFLLTEGILQDTSDVVSVQAGSAWLPAAEQNQMVVALSPEKEVALDRLERHFYTSSSCGVCGKASIDAVRATSFPAIPPPVPMLSAALLSTFPDRLREAQAVFDATGGLHAAALFRPDGQIAWVREDVGRHNAVDKLIGAALQEGEVPLGDGILQLSGRISFELVQKALMAGIPIVTAVGAPSSLAVELAREEGITLVGFVRNGKCNIYTWEERITTH